MIPGFENTEKLFNNLTIRPCEECIWHTSQGCSSWACEPVTRKEARERLKKGKWVETKDSEWSGGGCYKCSRCSLGISFELFGLMTNWKYCPNCGAKMEGEQS